MPEDTTQDEQTPTEPQEGTEGQLSAKAQEASQDPTDDSDEELDPKVKAKLEKANREARNLRQRVKELEPLAQRIKDYEDANKSETQKLSDQLAEREVELQTLRVERVRNQAGQAAKLDPDMWEFITSADPAEALAQAKRLAARMALPEPGAANLRQGSRTPAKPPASANDALRAMAGYQQP